MSIAANHTLTMKMSRFIVMFVKSESNQLTGIKMKYEFELGIIAAFILGFLGAYYVV